MAKELTKNPTSHWPFRRRGYWSPARRWLRDWFPEVAEFQTPDFWTVEEEADWVPAINLTDKGDRLVMEVDLPGVE